MPQDLFDLDGDGLVNDELLSLDFAEHLRVVGELDRGAIELPPVSPACLADCAPLPNGDGVVSVLDLLLVINNWGTCPLPEIACPGDIDGPCDGQGNGQIDVLDLLLVINQWDQTCGGEGGPAGGGGEYPRSIQECMDKFTEAGLTGQEWSTAVNECIQWLCDQQIIDCD